MEYSPSLGIQVEEEGMKYANRGDPTEPDFELTDLTIDDTWHDLDLSAIAPESAANHLVHIVTDLASKDPAGLDIIEFAKPGTSGLYNKSFTNWTLPTPQPSFTGDIWVEMDANRKIQYKGTSDMGLLSATITVRGWWVG